MKVIKKILLILLVLFVIAQLFGPKKNLGELASIDAFYAETNPPENVKLILKESCNDCHSDVTRYPWYNAITPVNYWLEEHVNNGKRHLNFSKWGSYSVKSKHHKLEEFVEMVEHKDMPLPSYTWTHTEAKLSDSQIKEVIDWARRVRQNYSAELQKE
jgi:hypothetical protein